jgi:diguanylate cyclase (GGDEF)-like protein
MATISAVCNEHGIATHYIALVNDITPMKEHQNQLEKIAHYDVLTNLPNRVLLADRLSQAMLQCSRHKHLLAVVFLDLDGFKAVNDTHCHDVGDELLIALSVRMKEALREGDTLARIGGDEFVAILTDLDKVEDCEPVLERLLLAASEPITVTNVIFHLSASIGITIYPQDNANADQLVRHADQAMYVAKSSGKNCYHLFDIAQDDAVKMHQVNLEAIRHALDHHQFVLHYQPKINMKTGIVIGVEALIRWQHPKRGLLNPGDFLPIIEHNPMNIELGEWVIDTALTQLSEWQKMGLNLLNISVNIAAVQLKQSSFTQTLSSLLAAHPDVNPHCLELEVLETSALDDIQHISNIMNDCIALGVNFALDDFGTGYSSLTYLRRLPASMIKIDQSFIQDMLVDVEDLAIVESVIALAKSFKRGVIAEGVESVEHCRTLLKLGCDLAQGNNIAKPMPASDIPAWVNHWQPDVSWQTQ